MYPSLFEEEDQHLEISPTSFKKKRSYYAKDVRKVFKAIRAQSKCTDCGFKLKPGVLQFHHVEEGTREPTRTRRSRTVQPQSCGTIPEMESEMKKGFFVCPTCHTCRHHDDETGVLDTANKNLR